MTTTHYILLGWAVFVTLVYSYMFYDIHATELDLKGKCRRLYEALTEEE